MRIVLSVLSLGSSLVAAPFLLDLPPALEPAATFAKLNESLSKARTCAARAGVGAAPEGPMAPDALLKLGEGLGALGQVQEGCVTLAEVGKRFPTSMAATQATVAMQGFGCQ